MRNISILIDIPLSSRSQPFHLVNLGTYLRPHSTIVLLPKLLVKINSLVLILILASLSCLANNPAMGKIGKYTQLTTRKASPVITTIVDSASCFGSEVGILQLKKPNKNAKIFQKLYRLGDGHAEDSRSIEYIKVSSYY
jgi:hypothetical protein